MLENVTSADTPTTTASFELNGIDHIRFCVGNAQQTAFYYTRAFGMSPTAYRGPEHGPCDHAEYVVEAGQVRFVLAGGARPGAPAARWAAEHGDGVSDIALDVPDVDAAYRRALAGGAVGLTAPHDLTDAYGTVRTAALGTYGELRHTLVDRSRYRGPFLPGYTARRGDPAARPLFHRIDHVVGCVEEGRMDHWVDFYRRAMDFTNMAEFVDGAITTDYSALMSKVVADDRRRVKLPLNEPAAGPRRSQIDEYLEYHVGPGVQHIALETPDILAATDALRAVGVDFLATPDTYYDDPGLRERIGRVRVPIEELKRRRVLVDRDEDGYLLQIFTRPLLDRPTFFVELIERHGCEGFGKGNFKALFEAVEREQAARGNL
ncbi:4-hydroxyphenylpyruvate dioxygenase [Streptomyces minutiscleroticus]|uniref:4-hydroxyphenylpyruvate dioxygenase n=1 Tax=Streptomyces minutiscleroticus TaxID=68238 RepID=A0A918KKK9_9ACTN|nr:4-hydroxyphenylpyruvate dioxygenase [Streptomyces minutiscleroticus]GGX66881.1 4-hydroxyphenylpyruvate dioxygenase [Streptomyces minutiscleroticus]